MSFRQSMKCIVKWGPNIASDSIGSLTMIKAKSHTVVEWMETFAICTAKSGTRGEMGEESCNGGLLETPKLKLWSSIFDMRIPPRFYHICRCCAAGSLSHWGQITVATIIGRNESHFSARSIRLHHPHRSSLRRHTWSIHWNYCKFVDK